jgi:hypothetical protein
MLDHIHWMCFACKFKLKKAHVRFLFCETPSSRMSQIPGAQELLARTRRRARTKRRKTGTN